MRTIAPEQIVERLKEDNPWWRRPHLLPPPYSTWTPRPYLEVVLPLVTERSIQRAVVLMGPRRVGKTVLIHHIIGKLLETGTEPRRICCLSVDHPLYTGLGLDDILDLYGRATGTDYRREACYVFFDEIQYLKEWELHLKALVDRKLGAKCIVSGSAASALRFKSDLSGAGRFTDFVLPPLTFYEYLHLLGKTDLVETRGDGLEYASAISTPDIDLLNRYFVDYLNFGGYPEVALSPAIQADASRYVRSDIVDKVLLRDLPALYGIRDIRDLNYLFTTLAFNTANEVSLEDLSKGSGVAKNTIKRYIEYLEAAYLIRIVHRIDRSARRFKRANFFKVYLTNPSLAAALFSAASSVDDVTGSMVETAVFSQLFHFDEALHYARLNKGEVDIVGLGANQKPAWAVEVKWSDRYHDRPEKLKPLLSFCHNHNLTYAQVTTRTKQARRQTQSVTLEFVPASLYCCQLGYNILRGRTSSSWRRIGP